MTQIHPIKFMRVGVWIYLERCVQHLYEYNYYWKNMVIAAGW